MTPTKRLLYLQNGSHAAAFEQLGNAMAFDPNNSKAVLAAGSVGMYYVCMQIAETPNISEPTSYHINKLKYHSTYAVCTLTFKRPLTVCM